MKKHNFSVTVMIWLIAVIFLVFSLYQLNGDARIINYTGIVRGATQKLIKQELHGVPNDQLIEKLDLILHELQTGKGEEGLRKLDNAKFQNDLHKMDDMWSTLKEQIQSVRQGKDANSLYEQSEAYFELADDAVHNAEMASTKKLSESVGILVLYLIVSTSILFYSHRRKQRTIEALFYKDRLTGIDNIASLEQKFDVLQNNAVETYAVIRMDIDNFKYINDTYGYQTGDMILKLIAQKLYTTYTAAAHLNADNFIIVAKAKEHIDDEIRELLQNEIEQHISLNISKDISYSMGIYLYSSEDHTKVTSILDKANIAHKQCIPNGKGTTIWYDEKLLEKLNLETIMKKDLPRAIQMQELKLYLQPKFDVRNGDLIGSEALVRWESERLGRLMPDQFIPLFERTGLIDQLDFYMLEAVCKLLHVLRLQGQSLPCISVNFSRVTLGQDGFYEKLHALIDEYQISTNAIELEITESAFNGLSPQLIQMLEQLRSEGFSISMDDFGSGYSSLNLISTLPMNILKIDKDFLRDTITQKKSHDLIACIVDIAHLLGMQVICEGVESLQHVQLLIDVHCDYAQGYYYARPMPWTDFLKQYYNQESNKSASVK